jgi:hypothetical protein
MCKQNNDILTALAVGTDGKLHVAWVVGTAAWNGPVAFGPAFAPGGAPVTMCKQTDNLLTAIAVGNDGKMHVAWVVGIGNWQGPVAFGVPFAPPGAGVAMAKQNDNLLTAMVIGDDGGIWVSWVQGTGPWNGPVRLPGPAGQFPPGANIAMCKQTGNILTAMAVDKNNRINVAWVVDTNPWNGPVAI